MKQRVMGFLVGVMLCASAHSALALREGVEVTATTQYDQGLDFTVPATPERDGAVIIRLKLPQKGKLQNVTMLDMELTDDKGALLMAPLASTTQNGAVEVAFQISRKLAKQCAIDLFPAPTPEQGDDLVYYIVRLKGYVPAPGVDPG